MKLNKCYFYFLFFLFFFFNLSSSTLEANDIKIETKLLLKDIKYVDKISIYDNIIVDDSIGINVYDISSNTYIQIYDSGIRPAIYGDLIAFRIGNFTTNQIYCYNISNGSGKIISNTSGNWGDPDIYKNLIVALGTYDSVNEHIFLYNLSNSTEIPICTNNASQRNPKIWGNYVVWQDNRNGNWDVYMYDLEKHEETQLTSGINYSSGATINNGKIVWLEAKNEEKGNLILYDINKKTKTNITEYVKSGWGHHDLWGDNVIWTKNTILSIYNIKRKTEYNLEMVNLSLISGIDIWENRIVVAGLARNGGEDIYLVEFELHPDDTPSDSISGKAVLAGLVLLLVVAGSLMWLYFYAKALRSKPDDAVISGVLEADAGKRREAEGGKEEAGGKAGGSNSPRRREEEHKTRRMNKTCMQEKQE